jgi:diguanylate cyclase (GGDEF)-like protein
MNAAGKRNSPRIAYRLAIASSFSAGAALLMAVIMMIIVEFFSLRNTLLDETRVKAELISDNVSAALVFQDAKAASEIIGTLQASSVVSGAVLMDADRAILAMYPKGYLPASSYLDRSDREDHRFALDKLEVWAPVKHHGSGIGELYIVVSMSGLYRQLAFFSLISVSIALVAMLVAYTLLSRVRYSVRQAEQRLRYLAHVDPVTGMANRNAFSDRLEFSIGEASQFGESLAVLVLDLDNFKQVNDTLGHEAGDELLRVIGQRLSNALRREDVVARLGGDEFAFVLRHIGSHEEAARVCDKLVSAIALPVPIGPHSFFVTASIGMSFYPEDGEDGKTLVRNADTAMYQAKTAGKNTYEAFQPAMDANVRRRVSMELCLRTALENGELSLHYQPKIDLASGSLTGFEALLRWKCDQMGGMVSPADFIPVAEDSGLIVSIGEWVIRRALEDIEKWNRGRSSKLHVAVNLSVRQIRVGNIPQFISSVLSETGIPAEWLELELTESMVMENVHAQVETFHALRTLGVRLAIDDFGTGYSSMSYLKRLPITTLKIDRSFVGDLARDSNDLAIATAIVALGHSMDLSVVAEGVETAEQAEALIAIGCDIGQGYLYARPMPFDDVVEYLSTM